MVLLSVAVWSVGLHLLALTGTRLVAARAHPGHGALVAAWQQWDGNWFQRIVAYGYHAVPELPGQVPCATGHHCVYLQTAFYPGYPLLARGIYELVHPLGVSVAGAMLLTNQLLVFPMAVLVYALASALTTSEVVGVQAVRYLLLFPFAYFLLAPYSEALFLTFVAGFAWALITRRYALAGVFGAGASATRLIGAALPLVFAVALLEQHGWNWRRIRPRTLPWAFTPLAGAALYALYQWIQFGDPTYSEQMSKIGWARTFTLRIWHVVSQSFDHPPLTAGYVHGVPFEAYVTLPLLVAVCLLSWLTWRRFGAAMGLLCVLFVAVPLTSGSMLSFNRYLLPLLPCFVVLATWARHASLDFAYKTLGAMLLAVFLVMFTHGIWTG
jgi:hypothetical protein